MNSSAKGQLSMGGMPASTRYPDMKFTIPVKGLTPPDLVALQAEDAADPLSFRFAINLACATDLLKEGNWNTLPDGSRICLLGIESEGAKALSVLFDRFFIPEGGYLFIRSADGKQVLGAYTRANNSYSGSFAVQLIHGNRLTIEYDEPANAPFSAELRIGSVAYAYRGVPDPDAPAGFGGAGPCEVNVNCPEGAEFQEEKKGVVRIQAVKSGSTFWCSGSLINNTRLDATPYILSADHCYKGGTPDDLLQWIFYFSYDGPGCENPPGPPQERALTGATLKARGGDVGFGGSDFLLLLLNDEIPDTFDVYLNGWNRTNTPAQSGVGIHHPQGDIKKISTFTKKTVSTSWTGSALTHWLVTWSETPNGHGVTEGGSSGSALFDSTGMIVGTLTGGESSCDSLNLNAPDYYGKFSYSWISCGPDSASQLRPWLDPENTGLEVLGGKPLSVDAHSATERFSLYPNPTVGPFSVRIPAPQNVEPFQVEILDSRGLRVFHEVRTLVNGKGDIDLSDSPPGIYLVKMTGKSGYFVGKIVKF